MTTEQLEKGLVLKFAIQDYKKLLELTNNMLSSHFDIQSSGFDLEVIDKCGQKLIPVLNVRSNPSLAENILQIIRSDTEKLLKEAQEQLRLL